MLGQNSYTAATAGILGQETDMGTTKPKPEAAILTFIQCHAIRWIFREMPLQRLNTSTDLDNGIPNGRCAYQHLSRDPETQQGCSMDRIPIESCHAHSERL